MRRRTWFSALRGSHQSLCGFPHGPAGKSRSPDLRPLRRPASFILISHGHVRESHLHELALCYVTRPDTLVSFRPVPCPTVLAYGPDMRQHVSERRTGGRPRCNKVPPAQQASRDVTVKDRRPSSADLSPQRAASYHSTLAYRADMRRAPAEKGKKAPTFQLQSSR